MRHIKDIWVTFFLLIHALVIERNESDLWTAGNISSGRLKFRCSELSVKSFVERLPARVKPADVILETSPTIPTSTKIKDYSKGGLLQVTINVLFAQNRKKDITTSFKKKSPTNYHPLFTQDL